MAKKAGDVYLPQVFWPGDTDHGISFYHGTNDKAWEAIQLEGMLWGIHSYRFTYLTPDIECACQYGKILLLVSYIPRGNPHDNYGFYPPRDPPGQYCWQFSVFDPIPLKMVTQIPKEIS